MKTKHFRAIGLLLALLCGFSPPLTALPLSSTAKKNLTQPTPTPKPLVAGLSSGQKKKLTGVPTSSQSNFSGVSASQKKKLAGVDTKPKSKLPGVSSKQQKFIITGRRNDSSRPGSPPNSPPNTGGSSNQSPSHPGSPPNTGGGTGNPWPSHPDRGHHIWIDQIVIEPVVLSYPAAVVDAAPGQIVLPAGYNVSAQARQIAVQSRQSNHRGSLSVATLWNGHCENDPASRIKMNIEARDCLPNHSYSVAIFSADAPWAKTPQKIGILTTDGNGTGYQEFEYACANCPALDFAVGLYEMQGEDLIAGPMAGVWAGQIGSPNCSR